jgi:prepilin-type N-terminal cleavage/methylation domain-containing protein
MPKPIESTARRRRRRGGFTTIELVVVIVVIGILAVVIVPRLDLLTGFDERGFHDQLKAALQYARKAALAARHPVCVTVSAGTGATAGVAFAIAPADPDALATITCTAPLVLAAPPRGCAGGSVCAPAGVALALGSGSAASFAFDPQGRPVDLNKNAIATVTLNITGSSAYSVAVQNETGLVQ